MNTMLPCKLGGRRSGVVLFEDRDDLGFAKAGLPHAASFGPKGLDSTLTAGINYRGWTRPSFCRSREVQWRDNRDPKTAR